jgi:hypothetical protein
MGGDSKDIEILEHEHDAYGVATGKEGQDGPER